MRIVLLGPPGSGKNAISQRIAEQYGLPVITCTSLIDWAVAEQSELGRLAKDSQQQGRLSDELLLALMRIRMAQKDLAQGCVLVDMPRTASQADVLDKLLSDMGNPIDLAILLDVDSDDLMERLVGRITCDSCGAEYNFYVNPPIVEGVCDMCGARVSRLPGDYEENIANRLRVYDTLLVPLIAYYQKNDNFQRVAAGGDESEVWAAVHALIEAVPARVVETPAPEKEIKSEEEPVPAEAADKKAVSKKSKAEAGKKLATKKVAAKKVDKEPAKQTAKKAAVKKAATKKKVAAKKAVKKTVAKKAAAKKVVAKKAVAKKKVVKKAAAKKAVAKTVKKAVAKKAVAKKVASKKKVLAKTAAKKKVVKKAVSKTVKKTAAKKPVVSKKKVVKKAAVKKAPAKKVVAKKKVVKKVPVKKPVAKKVAAKKKIVKKPVAKKAPAKQAAKKKAAAKKRR